MEPETLATKDRDLPTEVVKPLNGLSSTPVKRAPDEIIESPAKRPRYHGPGTVMEWVTGKRCADDCIHPPPPKGFFALCEHGSSRSESESESTDTESESESQNQSKSPNENPESANGTASATKLVTEADGHLPAISATTEANSDTTKDDSAVSSLTARNLAYLKWQEEQKERRRRRAIDREANYEPPVVNVEGFDEPYMILPRPKFDGSDVSTDHSYATDEIWDNEIGHLGKWYRSGSRMKFYYGQWSEWMDDMCGKKNTSTMIFDPERNIWRYATMEDLEWMYPDDYPEENAEIDSDAESEENSDGEDSGEAGEGGEEGNLDPGRSWLH